MEAVYLRLQQTVFMLVGFTSFGELQYSSFQVFEVLFLAVAECALRSAVLCFAFLIKMSVPVIFALVG